MILNGVRQAGLDEKVTSEQIQTWSYLGKNTLGIGNTECQGP